MKMAQLRNHSHQMNAMDTGIILQGYPLFHSYTQTTWRCMIQVAWVNTTYLWKSSLRLTLMVQLKIIFSVEPDIRSDEQSHSFHLSLTFFLQFLHVFHFTSWGPPLTSMKLDQGVRHWLWGGRTHCDRWCIPATTRRGTGGRPTWRMFRQKTATWGKS